MTKFGDLPENEAKLLITNAFKDALLDSDVRNVFRSSTTSTEVERSDDTDTTTTTTTTTTSPGDDSRLSTTFKGFFASLASSGSEAANNIMNAIAEVIEQEYSRGQKRVTANKEILEYFHDARDQIGGIALVAEAGEERMMGMAKQAVEIHEELMVASTAGVESGLKFAEGTMTGLDPMYNFFKDNQEAAERFSDIFNEIASSTARAGEQLDKDAAKRIAFFAKTLKMADEDVSDLLRRSYAFTGEASEEVLGQIGAVALELHRETGIGANFIKQDIIEITTNVDKFGNIGVDAAGRISVALAQLGVDFQSFDRLTDNFMNFDDAARNMGEMSALFGIQMDAMEMTYLANEDQEEFLFRMRDEIMDAGIDVENMSNTRARALANQLNMSVTEMKTFLRDGEMLQQDVLEGATDRAMSLDEAEQLTVAGKYFGDETERSAQSAAEAIEEMLTPNLIASRNAIIDNTVEANKFATAMRDIALPDELAPLYQAQFDLSTTEFNVKRLLGTDAADKVKELYKNGFEDAFGEATQYFEKKIGDLQDKLKDAGFTTIGDEGIIDFNMQPMEELVLKLDSSVTTQEEVITKMESNLEKFLTDSGMTQEKVDRLITSINEKNAVIEIKLDSRTLANSTFQYFKNKNTPIVLSTNTGGSS